jgi:hypothetical protein
MERKQKIGLAPRTVCLRWLCCAGGVHVRTEKSSRQALVSLWLCRCFFVICERFDPVVSSGDDWPDQDCGRSRASLRVQRSLRRERAILTIYCKYDVDNAVVSVNERNQIVDALCGMPEPEPARVFVRSAFDAARALASDERVARGAILQIVYSLSCAEQQLKLVHKDLHANNICLQPLMCGKCCSTAIKWLSYSATLATVILS